MSAMAVRFSASNEIPAADAWRAVETRDGRFDGQFVYAVKSTGVFCRPSCPSCRALRANVEFFSTTAAAERAGFRACLRCRPTEDANAHASIDRARAYLDAHADRLVPLAELSGVAHLSASHLQRSFKRVVGVSPKEYQAETRMRRLKSRLRAGDTVSRATYEAGFNSSRGVYERASSSLGMTPAAYRRGGAGVRISYTIAEAPVGRVLVATTDRGVCAVELGATDAAVERALRTDFPNATIARDDATHETWVRAAVARVRDPKRASAHAIPLDLTGTEFQRRVWEALRAIPAVQRRSYAQVAESIGAPKSSRAVAQACASNRLAVVIPCHRVVRGNGEISGYKWGVERKRLLLEREAE